MMGKRPGDTVKVALPAGESRLTIISIGFVSE
jgi:transcription elongation GreA/GreB family factor